MVSILSPRFDPSFTSNVDLRKDQSKKETRITTSRSSSSQTLNIDARQLNIISGSTGSTAGGARVQPDVGATIPTRQEGGATDFGTSEFGGLFGSTGGSSALTPILIGGAAVGAAFLLLGGKD